MSSLIQKHVTVLARSEFVKIFKSKLISIGCFVVFYPIIKIAELCESSTKQKYK